jgi:uncharacterized membrane protein
MVAGEPAGVAVPVAVPEVNPQYPPSLHYVLVTLGLVFTIWPLIARLCGRAANVLVTLGAVPLFVYVVHIYLAHALAVAANVAAGRDVPGCSIRSARRCRAPTGCKSSGFNCP